MKKMIIVAAALMSVVATASLAQTTPSAEGNTRAIATPDSQNPAAPVEGANSFTDVQAKERIEEAGYTDVNGLKLDDKGVWQATATKDGKSVSVALDYQGNVTAQ
ncbi:hypothetical protein SM0020_28215 [Sinorhizobium meliloti CCNWSX0020]|uniref:PepSY domain-containing protein n=1 Tax=Sinorhizobium meliloti CCNWSX0020 TaxID=1107881 RepID=H0G808_RHIML|nr:hypothetical protein [Sinorhizobium meliloti]EHK74525.1 hypothetical protein SM0020_28215 [Sinorhizobium meliloti CCNWSX0020]RVG63433.1 PepSY domain-containing protein [Sinorhizobium meliloti]RVH29270.1 PepSY domain-containing protein [Sinorhizobium meliloti]RVH45068.1 PepSY domain-containing protein [Sinorhizobium meliloti]